MKFTIHTESAAPAKSVKLLEGSRKAFGSIPNLHGAMAESPALLEAYQVLAEIFSRSSLTATEQQTIILAASYENECNYCMAAHTVIATMQKVPDNVVQSLRTGQAIADAKLETLRQLTVAIVSSRGWPNGKAMDDFFEAGYTRENLLEVVLGVGFKTLSNYTNHLVDTPIDAAFEQAIWSREA